MPDLTTDETTAKIQAKGLRSARRAVVVTMVTTGVIVMLDQFTKRLVVEELGQEAAHHRVNLIGLHIGLEYVENSGAAFGLLAGNPLIVSILATIVAGAFVLMFASYLRNSVMLQISLGAVLAGGLGNMIDRGRFGYVVDFVAVGIWPRFNLADSAVTLGVGGMVWWLFANSMEEAQD